MAEPKRRPQAKPKKIKLALQGGGSHGAFTWGVIDRLLESGAFEIEAIVGASAGAVNAAIVAYGMKSGGPAGGREQLGRFWRRVSEISRTGPFQPTLVDLLFGPGNMDYSMPWRIADMVSKLYSPYEVNPRNVNPLRDVLNEVVDFQVLREGEGGPRLFVCATNVLNGRLKVFEGAEISCDAIMASACLPHLFQAVEIDGQAYWDGGYCGNPPIFPLIYMGGCPDVLIVQINPINIPEAPRTARAILDHAATLSFNSSLMREMRMIKFVSDLIDRGDLDSSKYMRMFIHTIDAEQEFAQLNVSSKFNADFGFLRHLFDLGRAKAESFIENSLDDVGQRSSTDIAAKFL